MPRKPVALYVVSAKFSLNEAAMCHKYGINIVIFSWLRKSCTCKMQQYAIIQRCPSMTCFSSAAKMMNKIERSRVPIFSLLPKTKKERNARAFVSAKKMLGLFVFRSQSYKEISSFSSNFGTN